jgi:Family of unknown function (DUF5706)
MAKNDQQEAFEKVLSTTLARTIDFVKFAETKNAALLTFSSAWILASVSLLHGSTKLASEAWHLAFSVALPLFVISGLICMVSFIPRLSLSKFQKDPERRKSLLYFGDAAEYNADNYSVNIRARYFPDDKQSATNAYLEDLAVQINVNSAIAVRKFRLFWSGAVVTICALTVLSIPAISAIWRGTSPFLSNLSKLWQ